LVAAKEKQLVFLDRPADGSTKLVALISARNRRKVFPRAPKTVIADEFKRIRAFLEAYLQKQTALAVQN